MTQSVENLKESIKSIYNSTKKPLRWNIRRGHSRSISSDIEDQIALLVAEELPNDYKLYLDPSININGKIHRPDLVVANGKDEVIYIIEIKANMGWCRDASSVINAMVDNQAIFSRNGSLDCKLSSGERSTLKYYEKVRSFLVSLTDKNIGKKQQYDKNKTYATNNGIAHYCLFSGWYDELIEKDIEAFISDIKKL